MINQLLSDLQNIVSVIQVDIAALIQLLSADAEPAGSAETLNTHAIEPELHNLIVLLENSDMAALEVISRLQMTFGQQLNKQLLPLNQAINQLDFAKAIQLCQALLGNLSRQRDKKT
jgi:hypothetical protein